MPLGSFVLLKHPVKTMQSLHVNTQYLLHVHWEFIINNHFQVQWQTVVVTETVNQFALLLIMAYSSTPYVGMTPKKNGGHIESAQMTCSKCLH